MEKLKLKHLDGVFRLLIFFGILKMSGVIFLRICLILLSKIMVKHANVFRKLTLTRCFNFAFLLFNLIQMK